MTTELTPSESNPNTMKTITVFGNRGNIKQLGANDFRVDDEEMPILLKKDRPKDIAILFYNENSVSKEYLRLFSESASRSPTYDGMYGCVNLDYEKELLNKFMTIKTKSHHPLSWVNIITLPIIIYYKDCYPIANFIYFQDESEDAKGNTRTIRSDHIDSFILFMSRRVFSSYDQYIIYRTAGTDMKNVDKDASITLYKGIFEKIGGAETTVANKLLENSKGPLAPTSYVNINKAVNPETSGTTRTFS
jgi:hypothetical protein